MEEKKSISWDAEEAERVGVGVGASGVAGQQPSKSSSDKTFLDNLHASQRPSQHHNNDPSYDNRKNSFSFVSSSTLSLQRSVSGASSSTSNNNNNNNSNNNIRPPTVPTTRSKNSNIAEEAAAAAADAERAIQSFTARHPTTAETNNMILNELRTESNLIKDLDRTNPLTPKAGTATNAVMRGVPMDKDVVHSFVTIEDDQGLVLTPSSPNNDSHSKQHQFSDTTTGNNNNRQRSASDGAPLSPRSRTDSVASRGSGNDRGTRSGGAGATTTRTGRGAGRSGDYGHVRRNTQGSLMSYSSGAGGRDMSNNNNRGDRDNESQGNQSRMTVNSNRHHRRNYTATATTTEQNLFGLNTAWEEMKSMGSSGSGSTTSPTSGMIPSKMNDIFDTAQMLFNRKAGKTATAPTDTTKKNDDDDDNDDNNRMDVIEEGEAGDEELGIPERPSAESSLRSGYQESKKEEKENNRQRNPFKHLPYSSKIANEWKMFSSFVQPRQQTIKTYAYYILFYIMLPSLFIACMLYYVAGNPPDGKAVEGQRYDRASASWWVLFLGCRQVVIVAIAFLAQGFCIDFFALRTSACLNWFGPMFTLFLVQSRGIPFMAFAWGVLNFALCVGDSPFSNHWLFWQNAIGMMNKNNPPGFVTSSTTFYRIVSITMVCGVVVAAKRVAVGVYLGKQTFAQFSERLTSVMNDMLMIAELSRFGKVIEEERRGQRNRYSAAFADERLHQLLDSAAGAAELDDELNLSVDNDPSVLDTVEVDEMDDMDRIIDPEDIDKYTGNLNPEQHRRVTELLGAWEEPRRGRDGILDEVATVGAVMQFRRALAHMDTDSPFGGAFGIADTREGCIERSQDLYDRLMLQGTYVSGKLHFNVIAYLAVDQQNNELDQAKTEELIKIFRPDRNGAISLVEFVRSIDRVYKELRLLRATVAAGAKIDRAAEAIFNIVFYAAMVVVILYVVGIDPLAIFLSLSSVVLAFSFMIGSAAAKYFEGVLMVLIQTPYGIGDRVSFSNPESSSPGSGSQTWFVRDVTLYSTKLQLAATGEVATVANGVLAKSRIINAARSPNAILSVTIRFGIDEPYERIECFRKAVEMFVKSRPREWVSVLGFRISRIETEQGFQEYGLVLQHRESWQAVGPLLDSRNTVNAFCLELSKRLEMRYVKPPSPVELSVTGKEDVTKQIEAVYDFESAGRETEQQMTSTGRQGSMAYSDIAALFKSA